MTETSINKAFSDLKRPYKVRTPPFINILTIALCATIIRFLLGGLLK